MYAPANRTPPSLKPTKHFAGLTSQREVFGRLTQCPTGHAYTGEFRKRFIPGANTNCLCGEELETRDHILQECPRYENERDIQRKVSRDIATPEITGTPKGIEVLSTFLTETGAFPRDREVYKRRPNLKFEEESIMREMEEDEDEERDGDEEE